MDTDPSPPMPSAALVHDPAVRKLGKGAHRPHAHSLCASAFVAAPAPPASVSWQAAVVDWPMWGNDAAGNCAWVGPAHMFECWTANVGATCAITTADCLAAYSAATGYDPSNPATDQGTVLADVLPYVRDKGLAGHRWQAWATIRPSETDLMKLAIAETGGVLLGFQLPLSVQSQTVWGEGGTGGNDTPGSWGGHCVCGVGYDERYLYVVTWGQLVPVTWAFVLRCCDEAYACFSEDFLKGDTAPNGFDRAELLAALRALQGAQ